MIILFFKALFLISTALLVTPLIFFAVVRCFGRQFNLAIHEDSAFKKIIKSFYKGIATK